ncbi:hypothetical protein FACS189440_15020 [Bacteroidia bacterium]|nr:hypothetical protein FACS189440_15020 [Bacteroidia bacterium]
METKNALSLFFIPKSMLQILDTIISLDVLEEFFLCDLSACKGICCVEGDSGAPVEEDEIAQLEKVLPVIWNDLSPKAQEVINKQGVVYLDEEGEFVTSIVKGEDCVFTCYDENGYCKCAIEKACREGKTDFYKPVSCHLYPVRVAKYKGFRAVNYHRWNVCQAATILGKKENVKVYQFLKEPLIRKFGEEWYGHLCQAAKEYTKK